MKYIKKRMLLLAALILISTTALANPVVTWTDATGTHQVNLTAMPIDPGDPYYVFQAYGWFGDLYITIDDNVQQVEISASGSYNYFGEVCYSVHLNQYVLNNSSYIWHTFRLDLDGIPSGAGNQSFYYVRNANNGTWDVDMDEDYVVFSTDDTQHYISPGQTFVDKISLLDPDNLWNPDPNADFKITKTFEGELVPEPATLAALSAGLTALAGFALRKRK
ncbi:MAG: PEP-CTERM sorting domain-containing protein [Armatimonadota bacterium]